MKEVKEFVSRDYTAGQLNAMVKKLIEQGGEGAPERFLRGELTLKAPDLLKQIAMVQASGAKKFVVNDETLKAANVGYTGENFKKFFLGKVEEGVEGATLAVYRLERNSLDTPIMAELGSRAEIQLALFFGLLEKQSKGEKGALLTNGYANIAYIKGNDGNIWAVCAGWFAVDRCWRVFAYSVDYPLGWDALSQVLSRDS